MEESEPLLFTPDRRTIQGETFHFSEGYGMSASGLEFSRQDSLDVSLREIFQTKFSFVSPQLRNTLIGIINEKIPIEHHNLTFLAAATYIVHDTPNMTQAQFTAAYKKVSPKLLPNSMKKSRDELKESQERFKTTLLRYIFYVQRFV